MGKRANTQLFDNLSRVEIIERLEVLIFTASHDWQRSVAIDRNVRDMIVNALRQPVRSTV